MATKKKAVAKKKVAVKVAKEEALNTAKKALFGYVGAAYEPKITAINLAGYPKENQKFGGWDEKKKVLTPIKFIELHKQGASAANWTLDCIALAIEAGAVSVDDAFVESAFKTRKDFEAFCDELEGGYDIYWMNDRHFWALMELIGDEYSVSTYPMAGESLKREYE